MKLENFKTSACLSEELVEWLHFMLFYRTVFKANPLQIIKKCSDFWL